MDMQDLSANKNKKQLVALCSIGRLKAHISSRQYKQFRYNRLFLHFGEEEEEIWTG